MAGKLYLIPTFLGDPNKELIPISYLEIIHGIDEFIVENEKPARAFLKAIHSPVAMDDLILHPIHKHIPIEETFSYLKACEAGKDVGLLSDAGLPCVADPGYQMVAMAHKKGIEVYPLHGLSSVMMALMASGLNGQQFKFHGYLPHDKSEKQRLLKTMAVDIQRGESQIFIETPYRNGVAVESLKQAFPGDTILCVAVDLSMPTQQVIRNSLNDFTNNLDFLHKRPAVFVIGR